MFFWKSISAHKLGPLVMLKYLRALEREMLGRKLFSEAERVDRLIKISGIPGITHPCEEIDIYGVDSAIEYLSKNPGTTIYLDSPIGTKKWRIDGEKVRMPFHYGESTNINNPSDDMGWDVVIDPEASSYLKESDGVSYIPSGHNLMPVGYVPINPDKDEWREKTIQEGKSVPGKPLVGNDKIILSPEGKISDVSKKKLELFFGKLWNFSDIIWTK